MSSSNSQLIETSFIVIVKLVQSNIEVICNLLHVFNVRAGMVRVSVAETCAYWLIYEEYVVVDDPCVVVWDDFPRNELTCLDKERSKLHEVTELT